MRQAPRDHDQRLVQESQEVLQCQDAATQVQIEMQLIWPAAADRQFPLQLQTGWLWIQPPPIMFMRGAHSFPHLVDDCEFLHIES